MTKHAIDSADFHRIFGVVRLSADWPITQEQLARAALLASARGAVISHQTAARLYGAVVPDDRLTHVSVSEAGSRRRRKGLVTHLRPGPEAGLWRGLPITTPAQTFCDLAAKLSLVDLVVLGDSLVNLGLTTPPQLVSAAYHWPGSHRAHLRDGAALVRDRAESPKETMVRLMLLFAGLPEPVINLSVRLPGGQVYRLDLSFPELLVAVEYDGRHHAENPDQWGRDITRREHLEGQGWRIIVLRAPDIYETPWQAVQRVANALAFRGFEVDTSSRPEAFRVHFPGNRGAIGEPGRGRRRRTSAA